VGQSGISKNKITFDQISVEVSCGSDLHGLLFSKLLGMFIWRGRCRDDQAWNSEVDKQSGDDGDKCARGDCRMAALMIEGSDLLVISCFIFIVFKPVGCDCLCGV
jgi:hypothetical protein